MKSFFGIEKLKLKGKRVDGGYSVSGALPWVSNLDDDHMFGTIFEREDGEKVMFIADCANPNIDLLPCDPFLAMDGTGAYGIHFKDSFVPDPLVLAHAAMPFVKKIRAGFILLQAGMAVGHTPPTSTTKSFAVMGKAFDPAKPEEYFSSFAIRRT